MALYSKEQLQEIKSKITDWYEWYKQYLPDLQIRGKSAWCRCYRHSENVPSFQVNLDTGTTKCWSCGEYGDCFGFYMSFYNVSFQEAVEQIAEQVSVQLIVDPEVQAQRDRKNNLYKVNEYMCGKFEEQLNGDLNAWNYLTVERGLTPKIIKQFRLGCGINQIPDKQSLKDVGLLVQNDKGEWYSKLRRDRVVFPKFDINGNIVSFTGRLCVEKDGAKYMHTSNTEIYNKSEHLYGLNFAKKYIKKLGSVICVEGECFKPDAEILTPQGWVRFKDYNGQKVMQVNDSLQGEFVYPLDKIEKEYNDKLLNMTQRNGCIIATPNHNIVYQNKKDNTLNKIKFKDVNSPIVIPTSITFNGKDINLTDDELRLLIAIQADGTIRFTKENKYIVMSFKKQRKVERLENILNKCGIKYRKSKWKDGHIAFMFHYDKAFKIFPKEWYNMSQRQMNLIIDELVYWDGNKVPNRNQVEYSNNKIENATFIQTLAHLCGYSSSIIHRSNNYGVWYKISILFNKNHITMDKKLIKEELYNGKVYCLKVPSGRLLVRINNKISVVGNCDLVKCHQKCILNSIAVSGLNISETQINLLKKFTNTFYIIVEDEAILREDSEHKSTLSKFYDKIKESIPYAKIYVVDLRKEDGSKCDPDEFLNSHTKDEFLEKIKTAKIYNEYIIDSLLKTMKPKNIEETTACINFLIPKLSSIQNFLDRRQYIELVSNKLNIPENLIYKKVKLYNEKQEKLNTQNITWDSKPVYAQKILLSMCFAPNFDSIKTVKSIIFQASEKMEDFYKNILIKYIYPYIDKQNNNENIKFDTFFSDVMYNGDITDLERKIITDVYMKSEQLEDFEQDDVEDLIQEQIETLEEYVFSRVDIL